MKLAIAGGGPVPRVTLAAVDSKTVRVCVDGQAFGPVLTKRAGTVVQRWLLGGALDVLEGRPPAGASGLQKLGGVFGDVDRALDSVGDLLRNGLK